MFISGLMSIVYNSFDGTHTHSSQCLPCRKKENGTNIICGIRIDTTCLGYSIVVGGSLDYLKEIRDKIDQLTKFPCNIMGDTIWGIEIIDTSPEGDCDLSYWTNSFVISATCDIAGNFMVVKNERLIDSCMTRWVTTWQKDSLTTFGDSVTSFSYVIYRPIRVIFKDEKILFSTFEFADIHYYISYEDSEEIRKKWRN